MSLSGSALRVLVTRPIDQADAWVRPLQAHGIDAVALPLMGIVPASDPASVRAAWRDLEHRDLVMFVSPNAVRHFFAQRPAVQPWPASVLAASPGPGTTAALVAEGVPAAALIEPSREAERFDSEALWLALQPRRPWAGASTLVLRGGVDESREGQGREWLAQQLRAAGATVDQLAVYRREGPRFDTRQWQTWRDAHAQPAAHLWLFSSSEALAHAVALGRAQPDATDWSAAQALATHPRIAERAREAGFAKVLLAAPTLEAVVLALRAFQNDCAGDAAAAQ